MTSISELIFFKCLTFFSIIIMIIALRAWAETENIVSWCHQEFYKDARMPDRWPKPSRIRKLFFVVFNLKHKLL